MMKITGEHEYGASMAVGRGYTGTIITYTLLVLRLSVSSLEYVLKTASHL